MVDRHGVSFAATRTTLRRMVAGRQGLAFLPALVLGAYWTAGEGALMAVALGVPLAVLVIGSFAPVPGRPRHKQHAVTSLPLAETLPERLDAALAIDPSQDLKTACLMLRIEAIDDLTRRHGDKAGDAVLDTLAQRLRSALRDGDHLVWMGENVGKAMDGHGGPDVVFGVALAPVRQLDLEAGIQLAARLQAAVEEPVAMDRGAVYLTAAVGFCLSARSPDRTGPGLIRGAEIALDAARRSGPSAIRVFSPDMDSPLAPDLALGDDALKALETGEIVPWFQPQVSTETGHVTGFEALARWDHPERGVVPPDMFLHLFEQAGQMERLGETILLGALKALTAWNAAGVDVSGVAVNLSAEELRDPRLVDRIHWDLDRYDLDPARLTVEVLESVAVGPPDSTVARNIARLAELGCRVDLDDFGTGNASIAAIRRFAIQRIKIDRSFITRVDQDPEQQKMVSAILSMADRLGLETLAEGVETAGEHAMLAQLGCHHVQGFGIARPMPFDRTIEWLRDHAARLAPPPSIGRTLG